MPKIWVEKAVPNDPALGGLYILSEEDNHWDQPVAVTEDWWEQYKALARQFSEMQLEAARKAGYEV